MTEAATPTGVAVPDVAPAPVAARVLRDEHEALTEAGRLAALFAPGAAERDAQRRLPWDELAQFSASGLWGITVPRAHGGAGVSNAVLAEVTATLAAADPSLAQIPQNHYYVLELLRVGGTPAQRRHYDGLALQGHRYGNALAEIGRQDYVRTTRLSPASDGARGRWRLDGRKFYCTGALYAHTIPVWAAQPQPDGRPVGVLVFVPRSAPGLRVIDDWDGIGQRTTGSGSVVLDGVAVEDDWIVPFDAAFERPTAVGPFAQLIHAAIDLGIARQAQAETLRLVRDLARPWIDAGVERACDDPLTIAAVGESVVALRAAEALVRRAGPYVDAAQAAPDDTVVAEASVAVAAARAATTTASLAISNRLFELGGTAATLDGAGHDRHWRNARTHTLHDPVRWKYHALGDWVLSDRRPPRHGAI